MNSLNAMVVSDGERDHVTVAPLVAGLLDHPTDCSVFRAWSSIRLAHGSGFARKLRWAVREALDQGAAGLVATVDRDKSPRGSRLKDLEGGRQEERADPKSLGATLPIAIGEANPHAEAWLLDDTQAVRLALSLGGSAPIPNVTKVDSPKKVLNALCDQAGRGGIAVLGEIAALVRLDRSPHAKETGFRAFAEDVRAELGPVVKNEGRR